VIGLVSTMKVSFRTEATIVIQIGNVGLVDRESAEIAKDSVALPKY
jgi:hypothetical protein